MNNKKKIYLVLFFVFLIVAIGASAYAIHYYVGLRHSEEVAEDLREQIQNSTETTQEVSLPPETVPESSEEESTEPVPEVDYSMYADLEEEMFRLVPFDTMQEETNKDIYAWIYIPDTNIDYPVLQHPTDDTYYLNYNIDGSKGYPGCIYTEKDNSKDFTDFNTVLYGHNMKNGTMFHDLHKFEKEDFFDDHLYVYIYLPDRTLKYTIYAAYTYDDRHLLHSYDYTEAAGREGYLDIIFGSRSLSAHIRKDMRESMDADSNIITLSTCIGGQSNNRYLVQAVLTEEIPMEAVTALQPVSDEDGINES